VTAAAAAQATVIPFSVRVTTLWRDSRGDHTVSLDSIRLGPAP
jgi:hypothetical protein